MRNIIRYKLADGLHYLLLNEAHNVSNLPSFIRNGTDHILYAPMREMCYRKDTYQYNNNKRHYIHRKVKILEYLGQLKLHNMLYDLSGRMLHIALFKNV